MSIFSKTLFDKRQNIVYVFLLAFTFSLPRTLVEAMTFLLLSARDAAYPNAEEKGSDSLAEKNVNQSKELRLSLSLSGLPALLPALPCSCQENDKQTKSHLLSPAHNILSAVPAFD